MFSLRGHKAFPALLLVVALSSVALTAQTMQKQGTGVITGRVTLGDKGVANVPVFLYPSERTGPNQTTVARATTDYEGHYRMIGVPAGHYTVSVFTPTMIGPSDGFYGRSGKFVTIAEGEIVEKIDFSLVRGGVITGRVTDTDGSPVIAERVQLNPLDSKDRRLSFSNFNPYMYETDDRGIYRIYGIPPGRYTVSVGQAAGEGSVRIGMGGRGYYARTFYPNVADQSMATVVEVSEGSEATNIDITLGRKSKSFVAAGRVVDENGQPIAGIRVAYGALLQNNQMGDYGPGTMSDAQGRFRLEGLLPGRYMAFVFNDGKSDSYSNPAPFQIAEGDISGLELKMHRGSSISGVVVIEGVTGKDALTKLQRLSINAFPQRRDSGPLYASRAVISPDGSFRINGLAPETVGISISGYPPPKGLRLLRVERDGIEQSGGIELKAGEDVTGVRVVIEYGTGSIRGQIKVEGGSLPEGSRLFIWTRRAGSRTPNNMQPAQVDARGSFLVEGLATGDYDLALDAYIRPGVPPIRLRQTVSVTNGVESATTFTLNLSPKGKEGDSNE